MGGWSIRAQPEVIRAIMLDSACYCMDTKRDCMPRLEAIRAIAWEGSPKPQATEGGGGCGGLSSALMARIASEFR